MQKKEDQEIRLKDFIEEIRKELFALNTQNPLFFVDKVELELSVKIVKQGQAGIQISVLNVLGANAGGSMSGEHNNIVKISLTPLMSREELYEKIKQDPISAKALEISSKIALLKSDEIVGE